MSGPIIFVDGTVEGCVTALKLLSSRLPSLQVFTTVDVQAFDSFLPRSAHVVKVNSHEESLSQLKDQPPHIPVIWLRETSLFLLPDALLIAVSTVAELGDSAVVTFVDPSGVGAQQQLGTGLFFMNGRHWVSGIPPKGESFACALGVLQSEEAFVKNSLQNALFLTHAVTAGKRRWLAPIPSLGALVPAAMPPGIPWQQLLAKKSE